MKRTYKIGDVFDGTFGPVTLVKDFLPPIDQLVYKREPKHVKVTLSLEAKSIAFFKKEAKRLGGSYQRMMRNLLSDYAEKYSRQ